MRKHPGEFHFYVDVWTSWMVKNFSHLFLFLKYVTVSVHMKTVTQGLKHKERPKILDMKSTNSTEHVSWETIVLYVCSKMKKKKNMTVTSRESTFFIPLRTQRKQSITSIWNTTFNILFLQNLISDKINKELGVFHTKEANAIWLNWEFIPI